MNVIPKAIWTFIASFLFIFSLSLLHKQSIRQHVQQGETTISSILNGTKISFMLPNDGVSDRSLETSEYPIIVSAPMPKPGTEAHDEMESTDIIVVKNNRYYFMIHNDVEHTFLLRRVDDFTLEEEMTSSFFEDPKPSHSNYFRSRNYNAPEYPVINSDFDCFRNVDGIYQTMDFLAAEYPKLVDVVDLGPSFRRSIRLGGNVIKAMILTNKESNAAKSPLFVLCGIHAREFAPVEGCARFAEDILAEYGKDSDKTWILDYTEIHMVLLANPDGRKSEERLLYRFKRKNVHGDFNLGCPFSRFGGVDLNRNFPHPEWGTAGTPQGRFPKCGDQYPGKYPGSEKETQAIMKHMESVLPAGMNKKDINTGAFSSDSMGVLIDIHSFGEDFFWPYGYNKTITTQNEVDFRAMASKMAAYTEPTYTSHNGGYPVSGDTTDYAYDTFGLAALTMEVGKKFHEKCQVFEEEVEGSVKGALLYAARVSKAPFQLARGPDVLDVEISNVPDMNNTAIEVVATASDRKLSGSIRSGLQQISAVKVFVDNHPYDSNAIPVIEATEFFASTEIRTRIQIPVSNLDVGSHTLYFQAYDTDGPGPVYSVTVEIGE